MSKLDRTRDQINTILNNVWNGQYATAASIGAVQTKADQNETDIATSQASIATNQTDIASNVTRLNALSGQATAVDHTADGTLALDLGTARQHPVNMAANVSQLNLSNATPGQAYVVKVSIDNAIRTFSFAPDLDTTDTTGIYNAGSVVTHPNGRIYKAATGETGLQGAQFLTDLGSGKWLLYIRTHNDNGYFPSQNDEDLLKIECVDTESFKVTPYYGS